MELLDPKNDYVFKRLFAESPDLLAELISAVRRDEPPVQVVEVMNPVILPEDLSGKSIELDVLAELPKADRQWRMRDDPEQDVGLGIGLPTPPCKPGSRSSSTGRRPKPCPILPTRPCSRR